MTDSFCSDAPNVAREACLQKGTAPGKPGQCMWLQTDQKNLCLPCEWDGIDIPCIPTGAVTPSGNVKDCEMACGHQRLITKVSPCTDVSGSISQDDCFAKGTSSRTKCMWTSFATASGMEKSQCGPCHIMGIGNIPLYTPNSLGPELGSKVIASLSQCAESSTKYGIPCNVDTPAVNPCPPRPKHEKLAAKKALKVLKPENLWTVGLHTLPSAPQYFAVRVPKPYGLKEYLDAAEVAARAAGWSVGTKLPPDVAINVFGAPPPEGPTLPPKIKIQFAQPPPGIKGMPLYTGLGYATASPTLPPNSTLVAVATAAPSLSMGLLQDTNNLTSSNAPEISVALPAREGNGGSQRLLQPPRRLLRRSQAL
eukprot:CAMPEP_0172745764 /NCGR_PEP_ID=MMETSP1074-20121228/138741_1 /TAXON_ID=2916 /ORGANISM="Ceratium fusus, Strain PA161109" /LENGTH=365 /DNA_ID=CAMNT_0013577011 /DNA_START=176 /DNA_END=1273 /DNA_ORIENTATION=+